MSATLQLARGTANLGSRSVSMLFGLMAVLISQAGGPDVAQEEAIRVARGTLAGALGVPERTIIVRDLRRVEWPDASLGCPEKGMMYAQVVTPGYEMRLEVGGQSYPMHVGNGRAVRCEVAGSRGKPGSAAVLEAARLQDLAREDLARRLNLKKGEVRARLVRPVSPKTAGRCSEAAEQLSGGYIIELEAAGRSYRYRADGEHLVLCDGS
jgi:hypothetical protein